MKITPISLAIIYYKSIVPINQRWQSLHSFPRISCSHILLKRMLWLMRSLIVDMDIRALDIWQALNLDL